MKSEKKPKTVRNLGEFLEARGFASNEPYTWARCFYKYTDCGPWASFLIREEAASTRHILFAVGRNPSGKLEIVYDEEGNGPRDHLEPGDLRAFGFQPDRKIEPGLARSLKVYRQKAEDFSKETGTEYQGIHVHYGHPYSGERDHHRIWISATQEIPEKVRDLYYEALRKEGTPQPTNENCIGITFGSTVEGSESYSGPFVHRFPFDMEDFNRDVEAMEKETSFYWERDNSHWFHLRKIADHSDQYSCHRAWDDVVWDSDKPRSKKLRDAVDDYTSDPDLWHECQPIEEATRLSPERYEYHPLPGAPEWEITEYINDSTF